MNEVPSSALPSSTIGLSFPVSVSLSMVDTLLLSSIVVSLGDIDAEETLLVGPFLFFFGKIVLL
jgi:hypothetical protein